MLHAEQPLIRLGLKIEMIDAVTEYLPFSRPYRAWVVNRISMERMELM